MVSIFADLKAEARERPVLAAQRHTPPARAARSLPQDMGVDLEAFRDSFCRLHLLAVGISHPPAPIEFDPQVVVRKLVACS